MSLSFTAGFERFRADSSLGSGAKLGFLITSLVTSLIGIARPGMTAEAALIEYGHFSRSISTISLERYAATGKTDGTLQGLVDQLDIEQQQGLRDALQASRSTDVGSLGAEAAVALEPAASSPIANPTSTSLAAWLASTTETVSSTPSSEVDVAIAATKPSKAIKSNGSDRPSRLMTLPIPNDSSTSTTAQLTDRPLQPSALALPITQADGLAAAQPAEAFTDPDAIAITSQPATNTDSGDPPERLSQAVTTEETPWRFVLEPYVYLPLETEGDVTIRNTEVPFDFSLGDILESLTFAFYGRFEAWKGPWAVVLDGYYFDTVESDSRNIPAAALPPGLLPPQITQIPLDATAETAFFKLDLAGAYRFGDDTLSNALATAETDFDLGPFVFDAIAGLRFYSFSNDIELSTPLGFERDFSRSDTFVEPMIGGRARWNFADDLAAIAAASISGFGIGTDISVEGYAGVDWLFSGNTSLTATYRLTYIDYSEGNSGFNLFQHGPAAGVKFRF